MQVRNRLGNITQRLDETVNKSLFGVVSHIHILSHAPIPLNASEMRTVIGSIIRQAKQEVLIAFYNFSADSDGGKTIIHALENLKYKAEQEQSKVNICILINSNYTISDVLYNQSNIVKLNNLPNSEYFNLKFVLHPTALFGRLNTKMIIVDSEHAVMCSGDPDQSTDDAQEPVESASFFRGSIAATMRSDYSDIWNMYCTEPLPDFQILSFDDEPNFDSLVTQSIPCIYISKRENGNFIAYTDCNSPYKLALLQAIADTKYAINILASNINDYDICQALADACSRGVTVNIAGIHYIDSWWGGSNADFMANLVSLVKPSDQDKLNIRWAAHSNKNIIYAGDKFSMHAKFVCIDNELVFIGSSSIDSQSLRYSREADMIFDHKPTALEFNKKFFEDIFTQGKDYFEDAYFKIHNQIELQLIRMEKKALTTNQQDKCSRLRKALQMVNPMKGSMREKLYRLIETSLPILEIPTGNKPGMPTSYNAVIKYIVKYGLDKHIKVQYEIPTQEKEKLIESFYFIPSTSSSHSLSPDSTKRVDHDKEQRFSSKTL